MRKWLGLAMLVLIPAAAFGAEPRWCEVTGRAAGDTLAYPPIAKAARVSGIVVSRMVYSTSGKVESVERVFGPMMLAASVEQQLKNWTVQTRATGDQPCETLVIAEFRLWFADDPLPVVPVPAQHQG